MSAGIVFVVAEYDDPQYWLGLASDLKAKADAMPDDNAAKMLREIAEDYIKIAALVTRRQKEGCRSGYFSGLRPPATIVK